MNKKGSVFDNKKLAWISGQHIMNKDSSEILNLLKELKAEWGVGLPGEYLSSVITQLKGRSKTLVDIMNQSEYFFNDPAEYDQDIIAKCWKKDSDEILNSYFQDTLISLEWADALIDQSIDDFVDQKGIGKGKLIQPLRVALSGVLTGPSMVDLMMLLGKETCLRRIKNILNSV